MSANFFYEDQISGLVCGLDEVGRGPLAGPVVAACVYIPDHVRTHDFIDLIQDSKKISKSKLSAIHTHIRQHCVVGIGQCCPREIDTLNILWASMEAMKRAYMQASDQMDAPFDHALVDGNRVPPDMPTAASALIKGDLKSKSIAAASIVAKYTRDKIMAELAEDYPHYGWERNAAYPSKEHLSALQTHGVTPHHRHSFNPVKKILAARG